MVLKFKDELNGKLILEFVGQWCIELKLKKRSNEGEGCLKHNY